MAKLRVGVLVFPKVQQLDLTGPFEVFASLPEAEVRLVWKRLEPIVSATGLVLTPDLTFAACPPLDVLCVPGGVGVNPLMEDEEVLARLGAVPVRARVVADGKFVTGGGVTAGIDMALRVVGELLGRETAEAVQLNLEYAPEPPFASGQPETAPAEVVALVRERGRANRAEREAIVGRLEARRGATAAV